MNEAALLNLSHLARRVVAAREFAELTQSQLSRMVGFKDRQTLAAIEADQRRIGVSELLAIMKATGKDMDFFTDPFRIIGEGGFSYRAKSTKEFALDDFEERVGRWLALWRYLGEKRGKSPRVLRLRLALDETSTFEQSQAVGEQVAIELKLGRVPAERLAEAVERELEILLLHVDMPKGVSGAAVQLTGCDSILINRNEPGSRRVFDLAHELFHVLTWDAMPPERVDRENPTRYKAKRIEQLADNFAGALLMPGEDLMKLWTTKPATQKIGRVAFRRRRCLSSLDIRSGMALGRPWPHRSGKLDSNFKENTKSPGCGEAAFILSTICGAGCARNRPRRYFRAACLGDPRYRSSRPPDALSEARCDIRSWHLKTSRCRNFRRLSMWIPM